MSFLRRRPAPLAATSAPAATWTPDGTPDTPPTQRTGTEPPAEVMALAELALRHAVHSVVPEGGPLIPFAIVESAAGDRSLHRFMGELSEAQRQARQHVRSTPGVARAAIAWDGYLTYEGRRQDAVFVEASDDCTLSIVVAHRYRDVPDAAEPIGSPLVVERSAPLL